MSLFELNPKMDMLQKQWQKVMLDKFCKGCIIIEDEEDYESVTNSMKITTSSDGDFVDMEFKDGVCVGVRHSDYSIKILEEW